MEASDVTTCWECDDRTSRPFTVTLEGPAERLGPFTLCPWCYRSYYLPLITEASRAGAPRRAPPGDDSPPGESPLRM
jgi:hypothetical protein